MGNKIKISDLIPYKIKKGEVFVFLQKRTKDAKNYPDMFGFFGGHIEEGESPEEAFKREIKEELNFVPEHAVYFEEDEFDSQLKHTFLLEVGDDFESKITVLEGQYGKWMNEQEASLVKIVDVDKIVLQKFFDSFRNSKST